MKKILLPLVALLFTFSAFSQGSDNKNTISNINAQISVYPNPTKDFVIVNNIIELDVKEIEVFNVVGLKVKRTFASGIRNSIKLDLSSLSTGIYIIRFFNPLGEIVATSKIKKIE